MLNKTTGREVDVGKRRTQVSSELLLAKENLAYNARRLALGDYWVDLRPYVLELAVVQALYDAIVDLCEEEAAEPVV